MVMTKASHHRQLESSNTPIKNFISCS